MPLIFPDEPYTPQTRVPTGVEPPREMPPSGPAVQAAAMRQENPIVNLATRLFAESYPEEPGHNPLDIIRDTPFEERHLDLFANSRSEAETRSIMRRIEGEDADRRMLDAAGFAGVVAQFGAGMFDPTIALPAGTIYRNARGGLSIGRSAMSAAAAGTLQAGVAEAALQAGQETRTAAESAMAIGSATLLSGLLGAGAVALLARSERDVLVNALDRMRDEIDAHAGNRPEAAAPPGQAGAEAASGPVGRGAEVGMRPAAANDAGSPAMAASAGAAAADTRQLNLAGALGIEKIPMGPFGSPTRRTLMSESIPARRVMADLAETPYRFEGDEVPTKGPAASRIISMEVNGTKVQVSDEMDRLFAEYRFGGEQVWFPRGRAQFERFTGQADQLMTYADFKRAVARAAMFGDSHEIPQVAQAAQFIRRKVFEPWATRAEKAIPEFKRTAAAEGEAYFPHVWNKQKVRAQRPEFVDKITDHYVADQAKKAAAKQRLTFLQAQLRSWNQQIGKLDARFARIETRLDDLASRSAERDVADSAARNRAEALEERHGRIANEAAELDDAIALLEEIGPANPTVRAILERTETMLGRATVRYDRTGAVTAEAVRAERRNLKRIEVLKERLENAEARKSLIEEYRAVADQVRSEIRAKIEAEIAAWEGKSTAEARSALKAREQYAADAERGADAPRLEGADDAVDRAVRRIIESDRDLDAGDLRRRAEETVDRILGSPDGRLPYDMNMGGPRMGVPTGPAQRGSLAGRQFDVSNAWAADWIVDDIEEVVAMHLRTMVPDVVLSERFGDVDMTQSFRAVQEDYADRIGKAKSEKARVALSKERDRVIADLAAVRDRLRSTFGWSPEYGMQQAARFATAAKLLNNLTMMGVAAVTSINDMAGIVFRYGLSSALEKGWKVYLTQIARGTEPGVRFKKQMRALGIGAETALATRQHAFDDITDVYRPGSRFERTLHAASDKFFILNLQAPLTDVTKLVASHVVVSEMLDASIAVATGKATRKQIANLAESGIDGQMATRIAEQYAKGGAEIDGVRLPNTADWTDQQAAQALNGAIAREVDIAVTTPGQEKSNWLSQPVLGVLGQFKSFTASSTERIMIANLQRRDAQTLQGLIISIGLGMMSYKLNSMTGGQPTSDRPQDWVKEGITRSGVLGWFEEGNALASKATRGGVDIYRLIGADKPASRFVSRSAADMLLGPTWGKIQSLPGLTGAAASGDWSESDTRALRRLIALQNLFYVRGLFNEVERGANGMFGVEMRLRP
ncbi:MAG TPA: hypothetical protein VNQ99_16190 [Xanthobacteraceae bacterium]|nr:hypothetical protein [Xanthobacteraceae bacterium]